MRLRARCGSWAHVCRPLVYAIASHVVVCVPVLAFIPLLLKVAVCVPVLAFIPLLLKVVVCVPVLVFIPLLLKVAVCVPVLAFIPLHTDTSLGIFCSLSTNRTIFIKLGSRVDEYLQSRCKV
ncbi:unnamed protein product [Lymnaea stagnalis]|uniref:Uncharacterized protein n=1 Tax=Lymnaea stagnalis TaxID=6523 RepID=A0AAV2IHV4_LYMST